MCTSKAAPSGLAHTEEKNMKRSMAACTLLMACSVALAGCATTGSSADIYTASQARREQTVRMGTVESVRGVTIDENNGQASPFGAIGGGLLGAVAGSAVGGEGWRARLRATMCRIASRRSRVSRSRFGSTTVLCARSRRARTAKCFAQANACGFSPAAASRG
jgi:predicted small secreted protein